MKLKEKASVFLKTIKILTVILFIRHTSIKKAQQQKRTTQMIILVTCIFGACNTLPFVLNVWEAFDIDKFWDPKTNGVQLMVNDLSNLLVILNSVTNFPIYVVYCKKYRQVLIG